jgi:hypothetical protein
MNKKLILILTEPRTGSYLLNEALNFYSLLPVGEFFLNIKAYTGKKIFKFPLDLFLTTDHLAQLYDSLKVEQGNFVEFIKQVDLNPIYSVIKLYETSLKSVVVKIHDFQFEKYQLDELLNLPYVEIIILQRSNRLARYISHLNAKKTNTWDIVDTSSQQVTIDREDFIKTEQESENWFATIKQKISSKNYLEVNYERDLENLNKEQFYKLFDQWFEKINLPVTKTNYRLKWLKKQNKAKLEYSIINYKEIEDLI